jgi:hypothetical protein
MISTMMQQNKKQGFFIKYKNWFIALIGLQLIPVVFLVILFGGTAMYLFMNNDTNFHPYKSCIERGFRAGHSDGAKDEVSGQIPSSSIWQKYKHDTRKLKEKVALEKEEYLTQFPESERGVKLAEMKLNNVKLPLQLELDKRFDNGLDFYADYVKQRVKRESFTSDAEYQKALEQEAWKAGYAFGYCEGLDGHNYDSARRSLHY